MSLRKEPRIHSEVFKEHRVNISTSLDGPLDIHNFNRPLQDQSNKNKAIVGTIGIRLHYGDGSVQHNGITIYKDYEGKIRLSHKDIKKLEDYQTGVNMNSIGNTGAFLLINKELFLSFGGFPENYIECLEDVELNLRCKAKGLKNITASDAVAYHYESVSRNKLSGGENRFMADYFTLSEFIKNNNIQIK